MKDLAAWLEHQAKREERILYLADALLTNRFWAYACYRLRYFFGRHLAEIAVHGVKVLFLYHIFSRRAFVAILVAHAVAGLLGNFWWGALEVMRDRVRRLYRTGKPHLIAREISRWLTASGVLAGSTLVAAGAWVVWSLAYERQPFGLAHFYGLSILVRLSLEFVTRTFHSGIYAIRRVYRPLWAMIGVEVVGFMGFLSLWPVLGPWGFPISTMIAAITVTALAMHYTLRTYRLLGVEAFQAVELKSVMHIWRGSLGDFFSAGLSYAVMKLDSVLVLGLFGSRATLADSNDLFVLFFIISPTIQAGFDWAQLFYFDLKRLEVKTLAHMRQRYEQRVIRLAWVLGVLFWGLACLTGTLISQRSLGDLYWLMAPFFVSRSLLASVEVGAFSNRRYGQLLRIALLWLLGFSVIAAGSGSDQNKLVILSLVTFVMFLVLRSRQGSFQREIKDPVLTSVLDWLARVSDIKRPVRIRSVIISSPHARDAASKEIIEQRDRWAYRKVGERIARRLGRYGAVTMLDPGHLMWFERGPRPRRVDEAWLVTLGGGFLGSMSDTGLCPNGRAALDSAARAGVLGNEIRWSGRVDTPAAGRDELAKTFTTMFPNGAVYAPDGPVPQFFDALSSKERRAIMADAVAFAVEFRPRAKQSRFDVTAFCPAGEVASVFVVGRGADRQLRSRWRALIQDASVQAALGR